MSERGYPARDTKEKRRPSGNSNLFRNLTHLLMVPKTLLKRLGTCDITVASDGNEALTLRRNDTSRP